jgi:hypothetical protein
MDHKDYRLQVECLETLEKMVRTHHPPLPRLTQRLIVMPHRPQVTYINISRKEAENIHTMMIIETSMANCKAQTPRSPQRSAGSAVLIPPVVCVCVCVCVYNHRSDWRRPGGTTSTRVSWRSSSSQARG